MHWLLLQFNGQKESLRVRRKTGTQHACSSVGHHKNEEKKMQCSSFCGKGARKEA